MLTARGWWFLTTVLGLLATTLWTNTPVVVGVCLALLVWFFAAWSLFAVRLRLLHGRLRVERELLDERGPVASLWAARHFSVRVRLCGDNVLPSPYLRIADRVPFAVVCIAGETERDGNVSRQTPLELTYEIYCSAPGRVRFEGLGVRLADLQGLFYHYLFVPEGGEPCGTPLGESSRNARKVAEYRVLPALTDAKGNFPTVKRHNLLPLLGAHRHRRPGSGSELLDLRDYLPGDPPKRIAWKASARRDRLMTKEFESEVPVRCTLFVDTSQSVRVGPGGANALARLVEISAAVTQATAGARDLPGLCLFDEERATYLRPARGQRHVIEIFAQLADAAGLPPASAAAPVRPLLPLAAGLAEEVYPELMRPDLNHVPFWLPWLWPLPSYARRQPTTGRRIYFVFFLLLALVPVALVGAFLGLYAYMIFQSVGDILGLAAAIAAGASLLVAILTINYARLEFLYQLLPLVFSARRRRHTRWRKRLAALLSVRYGLAPGGLAMLAEDNAACSLALQRFLAEHQVPYPLPLYDGRGRYLFAAPRKVEVLAGALLRAVGKGRDNELFVLLADLLELDEHLAPLLAAVKVAVARHHRVMVVCPWPPGIPLPRSADRGSRIEDRGSKDASVRFSILDPRSSMEEMVRRATVVRFHRAYYRVRRIFARLGVPVLCARAEDSVGLILDRLERLRTQERGVR